MNKYYELFTSYCVPFHLELKIWISKIYHIYLKKKILNAPIEVVFFRFPLNSTQYKRTSQEKCFSERL